MRKSRLAEQCVRPILTSINGNGAVGSLQIRLAPPERGTRFSAGGVADEWAYQLTCGRLKLFASGASCRNRLAATTFEHHLRLRRPPADSIDFDPLRNRSVLKDATVGKCFCLLRGRLAQLVRAPALQAGGPRFEPATAHH
jgi:hypothetical protein